MTATLPGFRICALLLSGPTVEHAEVVFHRGLNIVAGPSDTGKTYIAQCINFMVGGEPPKSIPEAEGYETARLELQAENGEALALERSLRGGAFRLVRGGEATTLAHKHDARKESNVSRLLLSLCQLDQRMVRKNGRGTKRSLSFRDIAHVVLVGEESIIAERSPVLTGQHMSMTVESAVFRLLLTGTDDSAIVELDEPGVVKNKQAGKQELLETLIDQITKDISQLDSDEMSSLQLLSAVEEAERKLETANAKLAEGRASASEVEEQRREAWEGVRRVESRISVLAELQGRFDLLQEQYASDLRRLLATGEAGVRLDQLTEERCSVCGALAQHHDVQHREPHTSPSEIATACAAEAAKIQVLVKDLEVTVTKNHSELQNLEARKMEYEAALRTADERIREETEPKLNGLVAELQEAQHRYAEVSRLSEFYGRRDELQELLEEANKPVARPKKDSTPTNVGADEAERFSKVAEEILKSWRFPGLGRVTFSEMDQDIVISGRRRASHGKGVRALTHAAFTLALLAYCREGKRPHPGWVVIDSPLVVYRQPDADEEGDEYKVKEAFYRGVASRFAGDQVIILENESPPNDLDANIISFTKSSHGRYGFLSPRRAEPN